MDKNTNSWDAPIAFLDEEIARIEQAQRETVGAARRAGATWQQVGDAFGITRQAAQQRFGKFCD